MDTHRMNVDQNMTHRLHTQWKTYIGLVSFIYNCYYGYFMYRQII